MKRSHQITAGIVASLALGLGAAANAQQGPMGSGMGPGMQGMQHDMQGGMQHGMKGGMGHGPAGQATGNQLMTPEERTALIEKMHNARTPEERQQIAAANHAEMQKRATEKGITLPEQRGPHAGFGPRHGVAPQSPGATENAR